MRRVVRAHQEQINNAHIGHQKNVYKNQSWKAVIYTIRQEQIIVHAEQRVQDLAKEINAQYGQIHSRSPCELKQMSNSQALTEVCESVQTLDAMLKTWTQLENTVQKAEHAARRLQLVHRCDENGLFGESKMQLMYMRRQLKVIRTTIDTVEKKAIPEQLAYVRKKQCIVQQEEQLAQAERSVNHLADEIIPDCAAIIAAVQHQPIESRQLFDLIPNLQQKLTQMGDAIFIAERSSVMLQCKHSCSEQKLFSGVQRQLQTIREKHTLIHEHLNRLPSKEIIAEQLSERVKDLAGKILRKDPSLDRSHTLAQLEKAAQFIELMAADEPHLPSPLQHALWVVRNQRAAVQDEPLTLL